MGSCGLNQNNFYNATVYYEYTADHKHTFVTYTYTYTNSCTEPGERVTKCKDCGYIQSKETLPAQGHDWEVVSEKKATCKEEGLQNLKCRRCGETKKVVRIWSCINFLPGKQQRMLLFLHQQYRFVLVMCADIKRRETMERSLQQQ